MKYLRLFACFGVSLLIACTSPVQPVDEPTGDTPVPSPELTQTPTRTPTPQRRIVYVRTTADSGPDSLREALENVQDYDWIKFWWSVFPPDHPATISVLSELPHIRASHVTLDASNAGVILDGSQITGDWVAGLQIVSADSIRIMGLQISNFPGPGIAISGDASGNVIGGRLGYGLGPFGQGNALTNNAVGIDLSTVNTNSNTITGNLVGTDQYGVEEWSNLGNTQGGIHISEAASRNTIGPDNIVVFNKGGGVVVEHEHAVSNYIYENQIYWNEPRDIVLASGGNNMLPPPVIYEYVLSSGHLIGEACPYCLVEIYSSDSDGKKYYEGLTDSDETGLFNFEKGDAMVGSVVMAINSDGVENTSEFSWPTEGDLGKTLIQPGNQLPVAQFHATDSQYLEDNHIGGGCDSLGPNETYDLGLYSTGITWARIAITGVEPERVDWSKDEFSIDPSHDAVFTRLADHGLKIVYMLSFWDQATYPDGVGVPCPRFKTEEEISNYLEFVAFTVEHFKDRVQYYEIWNEPDIKNYCPKWIESEDYIKLVDRAVDVIKDIYPEAKVVVGSVSNLRFPDAYEYLFDVIESDLIMPKVDVVDWHPMYGTSPEYELYYDYYYEYPDTVRKIKETAEAHGFTGEYFGDELTWSTPYTAIPDQPWVYSSASAAKYLSRGIIINLGLGVSMTSYGNYYPVIRNLSTAMSGSEAIHLPIKIESSMPNLTSYTFSLLDDATMVALWTDGIAGQYDIGIATITIPNFSGGPVVGDDVLLGFEQELTYMDVDGDMVIPDIFVKDYPLLIKIYNSAP